MKLISSPKDRQQDDDLRTLEAVLNQFPSVLTAQLEWCRIRGKSRASFFRYKRALEERKRGSVCRHGADSLLLDWDICFRCDLRQFAQRIRGGLDDKPSCCSR